MQYKTIIRGCSGLGDSLYLRVLMKYRYNFDDCAVQTIYASIFDDLQCHVVDRFGKEKPTIICNYLNCRPKI